MLTKVCLHPFPSSSHTKLPGSSAGFATSASFNRPAGVAADAFGLVYVTDYGTGLIRRIDPTTLQISTVYGTGFFLLFEVSTTFLLFSILLFRLKLYTTGTHTHVLLPGRFTFMLVNTIARSPCAMPCALGKVCSRSLTFPYICRTCVPVDPYITPRLWCQ
jgi:hypothetical protein